MKKESRLLLHLEEFNRKERFFLVGMALGNPEFRLGEEFRERLAQKLSLQVPRDAFVAMDYHLDWLAASLFLAANEGNPGPYKRDKNIISATQEDIDLLVAYESEEGCHIVLLEAKGVTAFSNAQFRHKMERLNAIFGSRDVEGADALPHFVLVSPRPPELLDFDCCSDWMRGQDGKPLWL